MADDAPTTRATDLVTKLTDGVAGTPMLPPSRQEWEEAAFRLSQLQGESVWPSQLKRVVSTTAKRSAAAMYPNADMDDKDATRRDQETIRLEREAIRPGNEKLLVAAIPKLAPEWKEMALDLVKQADSDTRSTPPNEWWEYAAQRLGESEQGIVWPPDLQRKVTDMATSAANAVLPNADKDAKDAKRRDRLVAELEWQAIRPGNEELLQAAGIPTIEQRAARRGGVDFEVDLALSGIDFTLQPMFQGLTAAKEVLQSSIQGVTDIVKRVGGGESVDMNSVSRPTVPEINGAGKARGK